MVTVQIIFCGTNIARDGGGEVRPNFRFLCYGSNEVCKCLWLHESAKDGIQRKAVFPNTGGTVNRAEEYYICGCWSKEALQMLNYKESSY